MVAQNCQCKSNDIVLQILQFYFLLSGWDFFIKIFLSHVVRDSMIIFPMWNSEERLVETHHILHQTFNYNIPSTIFFWYVQFSPLEAESSVPKSYVAKFPQPSLFIFRWHVAHSELDQNSILIFPTPTDLGDETVSTISSGSSENIIRNKIKIIKSQGQFPVYRTQ